MTKAEAARANGKKGGRPRRSPAVLEPQQPTQTVLAPPTPAPIPDPSPVPPLAVAPVGTVAEIVPALDNPFDLNPRQLLFVEAYFGAANFSASEAYRLAGYEGVPESVSANAARLIGSDRVQAAVQARLAKVALRVQIMDGDEALTRISTLARADIRKLLSPDDPLQRLSDEVAATIKGITPTKYGRRIELHDSLRATELMAKAAGRLKDTHEHKHTFTLEDLVAASRGDGAAV